MAYIFFIQYVVNQNSALILHFQRHHNSVVDNLFAFGAEVPLWLWVRTLFGANVGASPTVPKNI